MEREHARELETECERALSKVLRRFHAQSISPRVCHLMAKAAITVLEAVEPAQKTADSVAKRVPGGDRKKVVWTIEDADVARVKEFIGQHRDNAFVRARIATNLNQNKVPVTVERFWEIMVGCLLTTQQRSGPTSPVVRFIGAKPFPLDYALCEQQSELSTFVTSMLTEFGGLRRTNKIGREVQENMAYLRNGGWAQMFDILEQVRLNPTPESERRAARFVDDHLRGFGPKQSRNLLQGLGLTRFEVPIDSRIIKWLTRFGFPVQQDGNALVDRRYYERVLDELQRLCAACDTFPCVLDAIVFSSFDEGGWTEENVVW